MTDAARPHERSLRAAPDPGAGPYEEPDELDTLHDRSILVVDDDPAAIKLVRQILSEYANVRFATSGADALRLVRASAPDLILLDAEMPGQNGFEVCRLVKADPACRHIPIIFVTAHDDVAFETLALTLGAADFLAKPLSPPKMKLRVTLHLRLKQQLEALRLLATTDATTSLANRRKLDETLGSECSRARRTGGALSLLLLDIDFFKAFNDQYGHPAGDRCLRDVAQVIRGAARRPQDLAARFGGEEFAVVLPHTDGNGALNVAHRIRDALARAAIPHRGSPVAPHVTMSIGVSCMWPGELRTADAGFPSRTTDDVRSLIEAADRAMYVAKRAGRDRLELSAPEPAAKLTP